MGQCQPFQHIMVIQGAAAPPSPHAEAVPVASLAMLDEGVAVFVRNVLT
jgi:hypothetical protein